MTFFHLIMIIGITQEAVEMKVTWNFSRELNVLYPPEILFSYEN